MKKLKIGIIALIMCLFLTGCGCTKKSYIVEFDSNGGTPVESQTVKDGETVTEPTDPTKDGYSFDGWYIDVESDVEYDFNEKVTEDMTLEAKWSQPGNADDDEPTDNACKLTCEDGYKLVNGNSKDCKCEKINEEVSKVTLNKSTLTLIVGKAETVKATVKPDNAVDKTVEWKSSNAKVATVKDGKITAVSTGKATITATAGGKKASLTVTVVTEDQYNLDKALDAIKAKTVSKGKTSINYSYEGCTITNTANIVSTDNSKETTIEKGIVNKLYRTLSKGTISSTYKVVCGNLSENKTVKHTIPASTYSYTSSYNGMLYIISVKNATNYTLSSEKVSNLKYLDKAKGVQTPAHVPGTEYKMTLNSDVNTIYAVKSAE